MRVERDYKHLKKIVSEIKKREYGKEYYQDHKEERKEYSKKYYQDHKEEIKEKRRRTIWFI